MALLVRGNSGPTVGQMRCDTGGFQRLAALVKQISGMNFENNPKNRSLFAARLLRLMQTHEAVSYDDLIFLIRSNDTLSQEVIETLTTGKTNFFREIQHFNFLANQLQTLTNIRTASVKLDFRIWCAAASTGEEVYSYIFTYFETLGNNNLPLKLLATDINTDSLRTAKKGKYSKEKMMAVDESIRRNYFDRKDNCYQVKPFYRNLISFVPFNLTMVKNYQFSGTFDMISCRNVLYYFEQETAQQVITNLTRYLAPGGYLILGLSESGFCQSPHLKLVGNSIYQKDEK